jgi:predicted O-methyltransferase YrrM
VAADEVLGEIEAMTERQFLPIVGRRKVRILVDVIRRVKPKRVLEVGTLIGYSAVLMGKELESDAHLMSIEIHADEARVARKNVEKARIQPEVKVIGGDALKVLPKSSGKFDLVFIDADKTEYLQYLQLIERMLHKGSVIVADNAGMLMRWRTI